MPIIHIETSNIHGYEVLLNRAENLTLSYFNKHPELFICYHKQLMFTLKELDEKNKIREKGQLLFINLLPEQLVSPQALMAVNALHKTPDFQLVIEITEGSLNHSNNKLISQLQELVEKGCQLAIDDFGSGHSNFLRVLTLSAHYIKLDKSFIQASIKGSDWAEQLKKMVAFFHSLEKEVIVEGVESQQHYKLTQEINADYAQGFYFGYPEPI